LFEKARKITEKNISAKLCGFFGLLYNNFFDSPAIRFKSNIKYIKILIKYS